MIARASHLTGVCRNPAPRNSASWIGKRFSGRDGSIRGVIECGREVSATLHLGAAIIFVLALAASGCAFPHMARSSAAAGDGGFIETTRATGVAGSVEAASAAQFEAHRSLPLRRNRQDRAVRGRQRFRPFADAAPLREHAAKDCDAAVASRVGRVQRAADCDSDVVAEGNVSAESNESNDLSGRCGPPDVKPPPPGAAPLATLWTKTG